MSTLTTSVSGDNLPSFQSQKEFTETERLDQTISLTSATQAIDFSYIDNPTTFVFSGDNEFDVAINVGGQLITFEVTDTMVWSVSSAFSATITSITVGESNGVATSIQVKIYNG